MNRPDLHMHSTFSDGVLTPKLLVEKAASMGVTVMAVTDHDTFGGVEALGRDTPIPVIPGVELSLRDMPGLHLLGYGKAPQGELRQRVQQLAEQRLLRAKQMVANLTAMGFPLNWEKLTDGCSGTLGRMHIARAMVRQGYAKSVQEVFERYLSEGRPAYVPGERLSMAEALPLMHRSGFVPVLAHPALLKKDEPALRILIAHWKGMGLMGVEVYHPSLAGRTAGLEHMVRRMGLLVTGGSDYHQDGDSHGLPGTICKDWQQPEEDVRQLLAAMEESHGNVH